MTNLLITGSRISNTKALDYTKHVVERVKELGWSITVGDAEGVDAMVVNQCNQLEVPYVCFGLNDEARNGGIPYIRVSSTSYLKRDEIMVTNCDRCIAIWNGKSRGTQYTFEYAELQGKPTNVCIFRF